MALFFDILKIWRQKELSEVAGLANKHVNTSLLVWRSEIVIRFWLRDFKLGFILLFFFYLTVLFKIYHYRLGDIIIGKLH